METLRFAPIVRVSTEQQEKQGESLKTQTSQIKQYVKSLKGEIPEQCWQYSGQEHATPDQERFRLDKLLKDSSKGLFDAVIVCDASRWSRDNLKSKEGLNVLRQNGIRFFVGTIEFDLFNPAQNLFLGMSAEIGEFQAREQARKSIINRIERSKRGIPTAGKLPYGRTWDEKTGWNIDPEKQKVIQQSATRYLSGEGIPNIAKSYGINASNLHKILTQRSGVEWLCHYVNKNVNVDETIILNIPPLLDEATILAIHERVRNNITYIRGNRKHDYLLSGMIFCKRCGYAMQSYTNHSDKRYYRHSKYSTECDFNRLIPATELENSVLLILVQTFGDPERIEKAIRRATPDLSKIEALTQEQDQLTKELKKISTQKDKIVDMVADGMLSKEDVKSKMNKLGGNETSINNRLSIIKSELNNIPNMEHVKRISKWAGKVIADATKHNPGIIFERPYEWRRKLIEKAFSGVNPSGQRLGIYIDMTAVKGRFTFEIRGIFENTIKALPLSDYDLIETFQLDSEYQDVPKELKSIRNNIVSNMSGESDAHHGQCFHK